MSNSNVYDLFIVVDEFSVGGYELYLNKIFVLYFLFVTAL